MLPQAFLRSKFVALCLAILPAIAFLVPTTVDFSVCAAAQRDDADAKKEEKTALPLVVVNVAGVDRLMGSVEYMFSTIERPDLTELTKGLLSNVGQLKGMDRTKPFGVMLFFEPGLSLRPVPIGFIPVADIDELLKTVAIGPFQTRKVNGKEGRYEIVGPNRTIDLRVQGDYAFVGTDTTLLDGKLPDPAAYNKQLTSNYDIAISAKLKTIPQGTRSFFLTVLKSSVETELQKRDNEPEAAFQIRRANGLSTFEFIEQILTQGDDLTLGWKTSKKDKDVIFELAVNAASDSKFARYLQEIGSKPSYFAVLKEDKVPLTVSVSWKMDEREKKAYTETIAAAELGIKNSLPEGDAAAGAIRDLFRTLKATAKTGHFDFFAQLQGVPKKFVLVGGVKVSGNERLAGSVATLMQRLQENPNLESLDLNAVSHQGVAFHRLVPRGEGDNQGQNFFGEKPNFYVGAGEKAIWFAAGGKDTLKALRSSMDKVAKAKPARRNQRQQGAPFQIVTTISSWLALSADDPNPRRRNELAQEAFEKGGDKLQIDIRPTDNGARLRFTLQEGFIRLLGLSIASRYDRSQI